MCPASITVGGIGGGGRVRARTASRSTTTARRLRSARMADRSTRTHQDGHRDDPDAARRHVARGQLPRDDQLSHSANQIGEQSPARATVRAGHRPPMSISRHLARFGVALVALSGGYAAAQTAPLRIANTATPDLSGAAVRAHACNRTPCRSTSIPPSDRRRSVSACCRPATNSPACAARPAPTRHSPPRRSTPATFAAAPRAGFARHLHRLILVLDNQAGNRDPRRARKRRDHRSMSAIHHRTAHAAGNRARHRHLRRRRAGDGDRQASRLAPPATRAASAATGSRSASPRTISASARRRRC